MHLKEAIEIYSTLAQDLGDGKTPDRASDPRTGTNCKQKQLVNTVLDS